MTHRFLVRKRLSLSFLGKGWEECYINVNPVSPDDLKDMLQHTTSDEQTPEVALEKLNETQDRLYKAFIDGRGYTDQGEIDLEASDIRHLPIEVTKRLSELVMGEIDPNLEAP